MPHGAPTKFSVERRIGGERVSRVVAISHRLLRHAGRKASSGWSLSTTKNMSQSGLLFMSDIFYRKNDRLEIKVVMCGVIDIFCGEAEVVRVVEVGHRSFDVGVKLSLPKPRVPVRSAKSHLKN